ncbi:unnamed protein product [Ceutorhynchus assimilis]|uniref:Uncharacterized protein n=1 Tax=Ceutorhynchus assimilis TaxID=467358 RepID=A0A9N9MW82_9CUCU|nr:unnamed protein product [Ceutorhynchus assimilis]
MSTHMRKVLKGNFPKEALEKMSRKRLEKLVLELVECSSSKSGAKDFKGLYRGLCLKQINTPEWWPSEQIISQSLTADGKCLMGILRFLVYKCCQFFQKTQYKESLNNFTKPQVTSKRRTLIPQNLAPKSKRASPVDSINYNPVVSLINVLLPEKPITQESFLDGFGLQSTFNPIIGEEPTITPTNNSIKFNNTSNIPFSSDLGRELMKRDNHFCPEALRARRLEKFEWYVNKPIVNRPNNIKYEVTYQEKKDWLLDRKFKYPKRQIWQHPGDTDFQKKALLCRRLKVLVLKQDLSKLQRKLRVVLSRVPTNESIIERMKIKALKMRARSERLSVKALRVRNK